MKKISLMKSKKTATYIRKNGDDGDDDDNDDDDSNKKYQKVRDHCHYT